MFAHPYASAAVERAPGGVNTPNHTGLRHEHVQRGQGRRSQDIRAASAKLRQLEVLAAHGRLEPSYQGKPYSDDALEALENELLRSEQQRSVLRAQEKALDPTLSDNQSLVEVVEDPARVLHEVLTARGAKTLSLEECEAKLDDYMRRLPREKRDAIEKYDALLDQVVDGLLPDQKKKKKKKQTWSRDRLTKDLEALDIRSKGRQRRSRSRTPFPAKTDT